MWWDGDLVMMHLLIGIAVFLYVFLGAFIFLSLISLALR